MQDSIALALISLLAVALTAFVTWLIAQRQILAQHVTAERAKWRENVRAQALEVYDAMLCGDADKVGRLQSKFRALLNPFDRHDQTVLDCMAVDESLQERKKLADVFARRVSLLLKHDWERAKLEAGFFLWRLVLKPRRVPLNWDDVDGRVLDACRELRWYEKYKIRTGNGIRSHSGSRDCCGRGRGHLRLLFVVTGKCA